MNSDRLLLGGTAWADPEAGHGAPLEKSQKYRASH